MVRIDSGTTYCCKHTGSNMRTSQRTERLWQLSNTLLYALFLFITAAEAVRRSPDLFHGAIPYSGQLMADGELSQDGPLRNFEVASPVYVPEKKTCKQTLMLHSFGNSYGRPFVGELSSTSADVSASLCTGIAQRLGLTCWVKGEYHPPKCRFNKVVLNLTVTSRGRQFDRLGLMFLNDTEVFRTSTAEPTWNGIVWTYIKDMSPLMTLFKEPQKIIFDLPNIVNEKYTGLFNVSVDATFFWDSEAPRSADVVLPVSLEQAEAGHPSAFVVPGENATSSLKIPRNARKAIFTISACGQGTEEFWWSNVPSSATDTFPDGTLYGHSPFREVQLLIDGRLAGVAYPFPVVFTGGIVPGFWRPIAGIDAFDLKEDEIDITPWLPLLSDGKPHEYSIRVMGIEDDGFDRGSLTTAVGPFWIVTGKIFLWLDKEGAVTSGSMGRISMPEPRLTIYAFAESDRGTNDSLQYGVIVSRELRIEAKVETSKGVQDVFWAQTLSYANYGGLFSGGNQSSVSQTTTGVDRSSSGYSRTNIYNIYVGDKVEDDRASGGNLTIEGRIDRTKVVRVTGRGGLGTPVDGLPGVAPGLYPAYTLRNGQEAHATYESNAANNVTAGTGRTTQHYDLVGHSPTDSTFTGGTEQMVLEPETRLYARLVMAQDGRVVSDLEKCITNSEGDKTTRHSSELQGQALDTDSTSAQRPLVQQEILRAQNNP